MNLKTFQDLRNRNLLEGKCGACEFREVHVGVVGRVHTLRPATTLLKMLRVSMNRGRTSIIGKSGVKSEVSNLANDTPPVQIEKKIAFATETDYDLQWTEAAEKRLKQVPSFARGMVVKSVEKYARETRLSGGHSRTDASR